MQWQACKTATCEQRQFWRCPQPSWREPWGRSWGERQGCARQVFAQSPRSVISVINSFNKDVSSFIITLPTPSTIIAYGLSAIEPALNPTPNQTSAGPCQQNNYESRILRQSSTSGKGSPLMVMIADSVSCSIFNPTWPRETVPARATWEMSASKNLAVDFEVTLFQGWKPLWQFHKPPMCGRRWRSLGRLLLGRLLCLVRSCNRGAGWSWSLGRRLSPGDHCGKYSTQTLPAKHRLS